MFLLHPLPVSSLWRSSLVPPDNSLWLPLQTHLQDDLEGVFD
jgi:hypothetical protein